MDFVSDALFDGRPFRALAVVDCQSRECLGIVPRVSFRAYQVVEVLDRLLRERGKPRRTFCDNGPEFAGRMLDQRAHRNGVELDFSRPGKPTDNAFIESFNARRRQERLKASWFLEQAEFRAWSRRFAQWLFSIDHIDIRYSIEYDGVDIRKLSSGTRGIVLLLL